MSLIDRLRDCDRHDLSGLRPFSVGGRRLGWLRPALGHRLARERGCFVPAGDGLALHPRLGGATERSLAVDAVMRQLRTEGALGGWWDERCPVVERWGDAPLLEIERAGLDALGLPSFGVHLNGYVRTPRGVALWVARRAASRGAYPGQLDHLAAGGQPLGLGLRENMIKESGEEAGVPPDLMADMRAAGALAYRCEEPTGLNNDVIFAFDLELPADFRPVNQDGEVASFALESVAVVLDRLRSSRAFKFNVGPVILDFLLRHDLVPHDDPEYAAIAATLATWRRPGADACDTTAP